MLPSFTQWFSLFSDDPAVRIFQISLVVGGSILVFLVFFTLRDILLRTHSFLYQVISIALVALFPGLGFLLYLLIRPPRTLKQRETEAMLRQLLEDKVLPHPTEGQEELPLGEKASDTAKEAEPEIGGSKSDAEDDDELIMDNG